MTATGISVIVAAHYPLLLLLVIALHLAAVGWGGEREREGESVYTFPVEGSSCGIVSQDAPPYIPKISNGNLLFPSGSTLEKL